MSQDNLNQQNDKAAQSHMAKGGVPPHLYTKIVKAMKTEGLMMTPKALIPASFTGIFTSLLLCACIATGAFFAGRSSQQQVILADTPTKQAKFALLVKADDVPPADGMQQFREYTAWVENLKKERWAGGEALHGKAWRLHKGSESVEIADYELKSSVDELSGYFLFEAKDKEEALKIAQTCPHLNYKGTLELREIFQ